MAGESLPVIVLGGYLGAGKTTLLNRLLFENHGRRLAVIVNDFGAVNIDASLIAESDGETIALTNGCICCGMADSFTQTLYRLREQKTELDGVVVETSGVSDPARTAAYATLPGFHLATVIILVDAERVQKQARDPLIGRSISRQLDAADIVVVTKGDLVGAEKEAAVMAWVKARVPKAGVISATTGGDWLEQLDPFAGQLEPVKGRVTDDGHAHEDAGQVYARGSVRVQHPLTRAELCSWYASLPNGVLRVKGWVRLFDDSNVLTLVQGVGHRLEITAVTNDTAEPMLVLIGLPGCLQGVVAPDGAALELS